MLLMKKYVSLLAASIMFLGAQSQLFTIGGVDIGYAYAGPKLGGSLAFMTNTSNSTSDNVALFGYTFGVSGKIGITKQLGIQGGLEYTKKGYGQTSNFGDSKTIANYLGIPILAKLSVLKIGDLQFHGTGGIYSNVAISIKSKNEEYNDAYTHTYTSSQTRRVDFGFNIGAGVEYDLGHGLLVFDLYYEQGVVDVFKDNASDSDRNTTQAFGLSVTYLYDLVDLLASGIRKTQE